MSYSSSATSLRDSGMYQNENPTNLHHNPGRFSKTRNTLHQNRPAGPTSSSSFSQQPAVLPRLGGVSDSIGDVNSSLPLQGGCVVGTAVSVVATPVRRRLLPDMDTSFTAGLQDTHTYRSFTEHHQFTTSGLSRDKCPNNEDDSGEDDSGEDDDQPRLGSVAPSTVHTTGRASSCLTAQSSERPSGGGYAPTISTDPHPHSSELLIPSSTSSHMPVVEPLRPTKIRPQPRRAAPSPPMEPPLLHAPAPATTTQQPQRTMRMATPQSEVSSVNCVSLESSYSRDSIPPPEPSPKPPTRQPSPPAYPLHQPSAVRPSQENTPIKTQHSHTTTIDVGGITPTKDSAFYHPSTANLMGPRRPVQEPSQNPSIAPPRRDVRAPHDSTRYPSSFLPTSADTITTTRNRSYTEDAPLINSHSVLNSSFVVRAPRSRRGPIHSPASATNSIPSPLLEDVSLNTSSSLRRGMAIRSPAASGLNGDECIPISSAPRHPHFSKTSGLMGPNDDGREGQHGADPAYDRSSRGGLIAPPSNEGNVDNITTPSVPLLPPVAGPVMLSPSTVVVRSPRRELQSPRAEQYAPHDDEVVPIEQPVEEQPFKEQEEEDEEQSPPPTNPSYISPPTDTASPLAHYQPFERPPPSTTRAEEAVPLTSEEQHTSNNSQPAEPPIGSDDTRPRYPPIGGPSRSQQSICSPPDDDDVAAFIADTREEEVPLLKTLPADNTIASVHDDDVVDVPAMHTTTGEEWKGERSQDSCISSLGAAVELAGDVVPPQEEGNHQKNSVDDTTVSIPCEVEREDIGSIEKGDGGRHPHMMHSNDVSLEGEDVMRRILGLHNETGIINEPPSQSQLSSQKSKSVTDDDDAAPPSVRVTRTRSQLLQEVLEQARRKLDNNGMGGGSRRSSTTTSPPPVAPTSSHLNTRDSYPSNASSRVTTPSRISNGILGSPSMVIAGAPPHYIDLSVLTQPEDGYGSYTSWQQDGQIMTKLPKRPPSSYFSPAPTNTPCHRELRDQRRRQHEYHDLVTNPNNLSSNVTMVGITTATPFATRNHRVVPLFERLEEERRALELQQHSNSNSGGVGRVVYEDPLFHGAAPYTYSVAALEARRRYHTPVTEDTAKATTTAADKKVDKKKSDKKREKTSSTKKAKREKKEKHHKRSNDRKAINDASTAAMYMDTTNNDPNTINNAITSRDKSPSPNFSSFNHFNTRKSESNFPDAGNPRGTTKTEMFDDPSSFAHFHPDTFPADTKHLGGSFGSFGGTTPTDQAISEVAGSGASDVFDATYKGLENIGQRQQQQQRGGEGGGGNTNAAPDTNDVASWLRSTDGAAAEGDDPCSEDEDEFSQSISSSGEAKSRSGRKAEKHRHYHRGGITEQARKAMEQTLAETAARERQAAKDRRPLHSSTNTGSLGASVNPGGAMTPMLGSNVLRIGFDMKGHVIREVQRTGPGVGGGQGSLFSSVAVPVGGGYSASQDAPNQNALPIVPAAALSSSTAQGALEGEGLHSSSMRDINDDALKTETKDAVADGRLTPTAAAQDQNPFSNNSERGSSIPASAKESTSSSSSSSDDDDNTSSSSSSSSGSHGAATTASRTSSAALRVLGDTQVPPQSNASASKDDVKPSSKNEKKGDKSKRKDKRSKTETATAPPSPQDAADRRASSLGGGKRVLALSKQTVLGVLSGTTTIDDATSTMPPAARKAATVMLTALRKKQLDANKKRKEMADAEGAKGAKRPSSSSAASAELPPGTTKRSSPPTSRRTSHASTLKPDTNTRPQSKRASVAFSPDKYSDSSAAAAAMHHYHTPWATFEERRSTSPKSTRHLHTTTSSQQNSSSNNGIPVGGGGTLAPPVVTRNLRYSATPSSVPSSSYTGSSYPPYNSLPSEMVSPGYHRQQPSPSSSSSGHYHHLRPSGSMHPTSSSLLGSNGYYFGTPSALNSACPHLYRNGVPYVDLEHILTTADPLMVLDANEFLSEDVVATSESRMSERDIMRRKEVELYEADIMSTYNNSNPNGDGGGQEVVGGLWGPHISSQHTVNSSRSSIHLGSERQPTNMSIGGGGSTYRSSGVAASPSVGGTSSLAVIQTQPQLPQHPYFPHALDLTPMRNGTNDPNKEDENMGGSRPDELYAVDVTPLQPTTPFKRHPPPRPNVPNMEAETTITNIQRINIRKNAAVEDAHRALLEDQRREEEESRLEEASRVPITLQWHSCSQGSVPSPWSSSPSVKLQHEV